MTALTTDRNTQELLGPVRRGDVAADTKIFAGALVMRDAAGNLVEGQTSTTLIGVGRSEGLVDNTGGSAGDKTADYRKGVFRFGNSSSGDAITKADIGKPCYAVDDQTVAKTDGTGARSIAGFIDGLDDAGVWVECDESRVRSHLAGIA